VGAIVHSEPWRLFYSFLIILAVGRTPWVRNQPAAKPLHTQKNKNTELTQTSMPQVGFETTTPVFERAKTVPGSDRAAKLIQVGGEI
jgi:hypothetical protein